MKEKGRVLSSPKNRRAFLKNGMVAAGAATMGAGLLAGGLPALAQEEGSGSLTKGDAAILRFLQALETLEADLWRQYAELGGATNQPGASPIDVPFPGFGTFPTGLASLYVAGLQQLDMDMPQYIFDNTDDEFSHEAFLKAYLKSKGAETVDLSKFATLPPSGVSGVPTDGRLTNLTRHPIDTSWWTRYRSSANNPDLDPNFVFPQAVPDLAKGQFTAIPRTNADLTPDAHIQAIANTAGFHMPTIEQGGNSLYPSMAQRANSVEVLRILISIGPTETMHFQTWSDKAGNAPPLTDPTNGLVFPDLNSPPFGGETFQTNLIMPEPCPFLSRSLPVCSIIRPTETKGVAMGVVKFLTAMGLFIGQPKAFFDFMQNLASEADDAKRHGDD